MKIPRVLTRYATLPVAALLVAMWTGAASAQTTSAYKNMSWPALRAAWAEALNSGASEEVLDAISEAIFEFNDDEHGNRSKPLTRMNTILDRAFGYVWVTNLESRHHNYLHCGRDGISCQWYPRLDGAYNYRFNLFETLALGVEEGDWGNAQVHEQSDRYVAHEVGDWEALDGSRGDLFSNPPQTRFEYPLMAITTLEATWPSDGWPAPEDVEAVWLAPDMWYKWKRVADMETYGEFTDAEAGRDGLGEAYPLGIEGKFRMMQYSSYDATFYQYELTNTSDNTYTGVYIGMNYRRPFPMDTGSWGGFPRVDYDRGLVYGVGWDYDPIEGTHERSYGQKVGWGGFLFLESPTGSWKVNATGDTVDTPSQIFESVPLFDNIDRPQRSQHEWGLYATMSHDVTLYEDAAVADAIWKHITQGGGAPILKQNENNFTQYFYDEPIAVDMTTFSNSPDCYHFVNSGPFVWGPGETIDYAVAFVAANYEHKLLQTADNIIKSYQAQFQASGPPATPRPMALGTVLTNSEGKTYNPNYHEYPINYVGPGNVTLYWGNEAERTQDAITGNYDFQGYRIYKSMDRGNTWGEMITDERGDFVTYAPHRQWDLDDTIAGRWGESYVTLGANTGIVHTWIDLDVLDGYEYWYALTAYDYDPAQDPTGVEWSKWSIESPRGADPTAPNVIAVIAGSRPNGYLPGSVVDPLLGPVGSSALVPTVGVYNNGVIAPTIMVDTVVEDKTYRVATTDSARYCWDEAFGRYDLVFNNTLGITLVDITTPSAPDTLYLALLPESATYGTDLLPVVDGIRLNVASLNLEADDDKYDLISYDFPDLWDPYSGYEMEFADEHFGGSSLNSDGLVDRATMFFSTQIRFDTTATQLAYVYTRGGYAFRSIHEFPGTAWDVSNPASPRQVNLVYTVNSSDATNGDAFDIDDDFYGSNRHYLSVLASSYSADIPDSVYINGAMDDWADGSMDKVWSTRPQLSTSTATVYDLHGQRVYYNYMRPIGPGQEYEFTTIAHSIQDSLIDSDNIQVVPNPYLIRAEWDRSANGRMIQFTNVPVNGTVDIYTLSGDLIASLDHGPTYNSSELGTVVWNIWTYEFTEAAYGLYIYVVKVDDSVKKVGKFAIIR